jgi:membrane-associated protease RseP (regulator of RpoE activity)
MPVAILVKITGKHIRNDAKIGTLEDFSQIIASMMIDTIGVERIMMTNGFIRSYKKSFKPQTNPKIIPIVQDKISPSIVLMVLLNIITYVDLLDKISINVLRVETGEGR